MNCLILLDDTVLDFSETNPFGDVGSKLIMLGQQFYHESIRKVIVAFGTTFNNIQLVRKDNDGNINANNESSSCVWPSSEVVGSFE